MEKFLIIDGNSLAFRAFYALPYLSSTNGQPTGAVYGFCNMLFKVLSECKPSHIVVAFDFSRKTFRNEIFSEYKGTRKETPDELRSQFPIIKDLLRAMKIKVVEKQGIEADDIIGTFAKSCSVSKILLSGDRDLLQLVDENTQVWLTQKGITEIRKITTENIVSEFGVVPKQIIDLKALMGDASDNIPGVKGIGPKTAVSLIQQFDEIENLYKNLDNPNISKSVKEKLDKDKLNAFMSKTLATIKTDCEFDTNLVNCKLALPFDENVAEIISNLGMQSLLKKNIFFDSDFETKEMEIEELDQKVLCSIDEIKNICQKEEIIELAIYADDDVIFSFNKNFYYVIKNEFSLFYQPPTINEVLEILKPILENENISKIVCEYKNLRHILDNNNIKLLGSVFDLSLANYLLNGKQIDNKSVGKYFSLKQYFSVELKKQGLENLFFDMELPLEDVLYEMEKNGFALDINELKKQAEIFSIKLDDLTKKICLMAGKEFNVNSPKQTAEILFEELHLPVENNKKMSTGIEVLNSLVDYHPIVALIIEYRKLQKLKSTYIDVFIQIIEKSKSNIIHTVFNQMQTSTGRLSSSEPNLQNIPVRSEEGKELRKAFVSRFPDGELVSADYNQIELRLLAHCSGDEKLIEAFNQNKDIHTLTASQIFGKAENEVTAVMRRDAKSVNFGIIYGISQFGLSNNTGITLDKAKQYIEMYFETYPAVKKYLDDNVEFAKHYGFVKTIFNRKRKLPELRSDNGMVRQFGVRAAKNMPLQGSASDIIKLAMIKVTQMLHQYKMQSKLILQIHDELVVDCPQNEVEQVKEILKFVMENVVELKVKLPVDIANGKTYFDI